MKNRSSHLYCNVDELTGATFCSKCPCDILNQVRNMDKQSIYDQMGRRQGGRSGARIFVAGRIGSLG